MCISAILVGPTHAPLPGNDASCHKQRCAGMSSVTTLALRRFPEVSWGVREGAGWVESFSCMERGSGWPIAVTVGVAVSLGMAMGGALALGSPAGMGRSLRASRVPRASPRVVGWRSVWWGRAFSSTSASGLTGGAGGASGANAFGFVADEEAAYVGVREGEGKYTALAGAEKAARKLRLGAQKRHILLCAGPSKPKCCGAEKSLESWDFLKARLKAVGLECEYIRPFSDKFADERAAAMTATEREFSSFSMMFLFKRVVDIAAK